MIKGFYSNVLFIEFFNTNIAYFIDDELSKEDDIITKKLQTYSEYIELINNYLTEYLRLNNFTEDQFLQAIYINKNNTKIKNKLNFLLSTKSFSDFESFIPGIENEITTNKYNITNDIDLAIKLSELFNNLNHLDNNLDGNTNFINYPKADAFNCNIDNKIYDLKYLKNKKK